MKKLIYLGLMLSGMATVNPGCKKYPENEGISLKSAQQRLYGVWDIEHYYIDGVDRIDTLRARYDICWANITIKKRGSLGQSQNLQNVMMSSDNSPCVVKGEFNFSTTKKLIALAMSGPMGPDLPPHLALYNIPGTIQFALFDNILWNIDRLDRKYFIFRCHYNLTEQTMVARRIGP